MRLQLGGLIAAAAILSAGSASATTLTLDGGGVNTPGGSTIEGLNVGNTRTYTSGSVTVTAQGWTYDTSYSPDQLLSSYLGAYSGLGLGVSSPHVDANGGSFGNGNGGAEEGSGGNQHTIDNNGDGRVDFVLLKFNTAVDLTSAYFNVYDVNSSGAADGDAVAYYKNGAIAPVNGGNASTYFSQFSSIDLEGSSSGSRNIDGVTYSDTWLIGAPGNETNDGFKLKSISFNSGVPEPATWATMILGFGVVGTMMRRRRLAAPITA
jgi:hypothetical protein